MLLVKEYAGSRHDEALDRPTLTLGIPESPLINSAFRKRVDLNCGKTLGYPHSVAYRFQGAKRVLP